MRRGQGFHLHDALKPRDWVHSLPVATGHRAPRPRAISAPAETPAAVQRCSTSRRPREAAYEKAPPEGGQSHQSPRKKERPEGDLVPRSTSSVAAARKSPAGAGPGSLSYPSAAQPTPPPRPCARRAVATSWRRRRGRALWCRSRPTLPRNHPKLHGLLVLSTSSLGRKLTHLILPTGKPLGAGSL
jgi:hypothetical protein